MVSTSEFDRVKERLEVLVNRGRIEEAKEAKDRPTLRRSTRAPAEGADAGTPDSSNPDASQTEDTNSEDDRPTLRRR